MQTRRVGRSGLAVSRLGLGTMTWGGDTSTSDARALVRTFVEAGGNLVDTAPAYGHGLAEKILGKLIHTDLRREELVIATKGGFGVRHGKRSVDVSRGALLDDLAGSLRRLHTDHVDLWQVHAWGEAPLEETLAALDHAVSSGMARYVGVCNYIGWQTARAATWQQAVPGRAPLTSGQVEYSLLARRAELEVLPALRAHQMGLFPWSPIGRGVLTGKYRTGTPRGSRGASDHFGWFVQPYLEAKSRAITDAVVRAAEGLDLTPEQVALLWVRDAPVVTAPLLGARTVEQLQPYLAVEDQVLPEPIVSALDDVTGGPNQLRPTAPASSAP
ncbi:MULTISPECIES: aldo/keto reductase [unclassified Luteococcus]|uniref:aldo/keto reductase n=1 Tax=unclassified Luteococcus TaxID=2639923 RepID=UPI00313E66C6